MDIPNLFVLCITLRQIWSGMLYSIGQLAPRMRWGICWNSCGMKSFRLRWFFHFFLIAFQHQLGVVYGIAAKMENSTFTVHSSKYFKKSYPSPSFPWNHSSNLPRRHLHCTADPPLAGVPLGDLCSLFRSLLDAIHCLFRVGRNIPFDRGSWTRDSDRDRVQLLSPGYDCGFCSSFQTRITLWKATAPR